MLLFNLSTILRNNVQTNYLKCFEEKKILANSKNLTLVLQIFVFFHTRLQWYGVSVSTINSTNLVFWHYKAHNIAQKFIRRIFDIFFFHSIPRSTNLNFSIIFVLDQLSKICLIKKIVSKFKSFCQKNEINSARFNMKKLALKILTSSSSARSPSSTATIMVPEMAPFYAVTFLLM